MLSYVLTKGLEEIKELGLKLERKRNFYGLAGLGDVIVTCTSAFVIFTWRTSGQRQKVG